MPPMTMHVYANWRMVLCYAVCAAASAPVHARWPPLLAQAYRWVSVGAAVLTRSRRNMVAKQPRWLVSSSGGGGGGG